MPQSNPNENEEVTEPQTAEDYLAYAQSLLGGSTDTKDANARPSTRTTPNGDKSPSYQEQVNALVKEVTVGEDGKFVYPDDTPEHLKYAVATEKKYRDTQGGFTKSQQTLKETETEVTALREQIATMSQSVLEIPKEDAERLEDLMYSDPTAWRREINALESKHSKDVQLKLDEVMGDVRTKAGAQFELDRRVSVLEQFNEGRATPVTVEILDNDIPPRISSKLAKGHLTFEGYLAEVDEYLSKNKVVTNDDAGAGTKLTSGAGSSTPPSEGSQLEQDALNYSQMTL